MIAGVPVLPGTKLNKRGALLLFCHCCPPSRAEIMGEVYQGKLTIEKRHHGVHHYVVLGEDILEALPAPRRITCMCCDPGAGEILAECRDHLLLIRCTRHQRKHFLALARPTLETLLATAVAVS